MSFVKELKRRSVFRVAAAYIIVAWLILQVGDTLAPALRLPNAVNSALAFFLILGLPLAVFFAWAYEMTPEGLRKDKNVQPSESTSIDTRKRLDLTIIGLLVVAVGYFAIDKFVFDPLRDAERTQATSEILSETMQAITDKSIAVLPFVNTSNDPDQEYFSDGISEELLNVLSRVDGLRVVSRTSSFAFKHSDHTIVEIAAALKVDHVLEGSVRRSGDTLRVTVQLIDVKTDAHLWSDTYDRKFADILAIQDDISGHIVNALKVVLEAERPATLSATQFATQNLEAYELYLQGRFEWQRRTGESIQRAIDLFRQATALDPEFARAWSGLAGAYVTLPAYSAVDDDVHYVQAYAAANRALELDVSDADAYAVLGDISRVNRQWAEAEAYYLKAIDEEPRNSTAHLWYGENLVMTGRLRDGFRQLQTTYELDPMHPSAHKDLASIYYNFGDIKNAVKFGESAWSLNHHRGLIVLVTSYTDLGEFNKAIPYAELWDEMQPTAVLKQYVEARRDPANKASFLEFLTENNSSIRLSVLLPIYVGLGEIDEAYKLVEANPVPRRFGYLWTVWRPNMVPFRRDSRFVALMTEVGLMDYWRASGWPDRCRPVADTLECD